MRAIIIETDEGYLLEFAFGESGDLLAPLSLPPHVASPHSLLSLAVEDAERAGIDTWTRPGPLARPEILVVGYQS